MRISHRLRQADSLNQLREGLSRVAEVQKQVASGKRVNSASDDPVAAASILRAASGLEALGQYRSNLETARSRMDLEDSALQQISDLMIRAREIAVGQVGSNADGATRAIAAAEIDNIIGQLEQVANTNLGDHYVFGGVNADRPPLIGGVLDPAAPAIGDQMIEVAAGQQIRTTHSAEEIFIDSGVMTSLTDLRAALNAGDTAAITTALTDTDSAFNETQEIVGSIGARLNQVNIAVENLDSLEINLQTFRSNLEDVEMEKAVTELVARQSALQAAMATTATTLQDTLLDYL